MQTLLEVSPDCLKSPFIKGKRASVLRIITNLLETTLKRTPRMSCVRLKVFLKDEDKVSARVCFQIVDWGLANTKQPVFETFKKLHADPATSVACSGLSLLICRKQALMLGGELLMCLPVMEDNAGYHSGIGFHLVLPFARETKHAVCLCLRIHPYLDFVVISLDS